MGDSGDTGALRRSGSFTLADWRTWPEDERWELIDGEAFNMGPSPKVRHQATAGDLFGELRNFLKGKPCKPFIAPLDAFLEESADGNRGNVVEPDVMVVCDAAKVGEDGIHGAPDFLAEVLSGSTAYRDLGIKKSLYERSGVREYWILHPDTGNVLVYVLESGEYRLVREYRRGQAIPSAVLQGFSWTWSE